MKPLQLFDYCKLQKIHIVQFQIVGPFFRNHHIKFPCRNYKESHERPEGIEGGSVIICNENKQNINNAINTSEKYTDHQFIKQRLS